MYKTEFLPIARQDMIDIVRYIAVKLKNPIAAERLAVELTQTADQIAEFPYANPVYMPVRPLKHEYRKLSVKNYLMFYWVDEEKKTVTVVRIIYAMRDYNRFLE